MDFNQFDSVSVANSGTWMHVTHPVTGEPMFDGDKPCRVLVLGAEGDVVQAISKEARARMKGDNKEQDPQVVLLNEAKRLVAGFENISRGDAPATAPDDVEWFLRLNKAIGGNKPSFVEQVRNHSLKRNLDLGNVSGG